MSRRATKPRATPGTLRRVGASVGVLGLVVGLMGCGSGGQSKEAAEAALLAIPGISEASVNTRSYYSGFQEETSTEIEISVEAGFSVPDPDALVEYLIRVAWSTGTKEANMSVAIDVLTDPQISIVDSVAAGGWESAAGSSKHPERALVAAGEVKDRFGDWPGGVPELPDGLIAGPTP